MALDISTKTHSRDPRGVPTVQPVQSLLMRMGISLGPSGADSRYGGNREAPVRRYQRKKGLDDDGVVGTKTWGKLPGDRVSAGANTFVSASSIADIAPARVLGRDGVDKPSYPFGVEVSDLSVNHRMKLDCSEFVEWAVHQVTGKDWADGTFNQAPKCHLVPVNQAINTKGALLFVTSNGTAIGTTHVAISMGDGKTAKARSTAASCESWPARGRFNMAGLVPILAYWSDLPRRQAPSWSV